MVVSFFTISGIYHGLYIVFGVPWILLQFIAIYLDYNNFERRRLNILELGFLYYLFGWWGIIIRNARSSYNWNCGWAIGGILFNNVIFRIILGFFGVNNEFNPSQIPVIILWGLCSALNFYAGMRAIPPRLQEEIFNIYKRNCRNAVFRYLKQNQGKAFSINALKKRVANLGLKFEEREYYKEHIKEVLNSLVISEKIESTLHNEELYYLIP